MIKPTQYNMLVPPKVVEWISKVLQPPQGAIQIQSISPNGAVEVLTNEKKQRYRVGLIANRLISDHSCAQI